MSGAEAVAAIALIDNCISLTKVIIQLVEAVRDDQGLPQRLRDLFDKLPIIAELLDKAQANCKDGTASEEASKSAEPVLLQCKSSLRELEIILRKACPEDADGSGMRLWKGMRTLFLGRKSRVKELLDTILDNLRLLEQKQIYVIGDKLDDLEELTEALGREDEGKYSHSGTGNIIANEGGTNTNYVQGGSNNRQIINPGTYNERAVYHLAPKRRETPPLPLSNVPFRRDPHYVERSDITREIDARLSQPAGRAALVGLGGVGKSQIAIEYTWRFREAYPQAWVLWLYAGNLTRFEQSVRDAAHILKIQGRNDGDINVFRLLQSWLLNSRNGRWLVVIDNADDADFLTQKIDSFRPFDCVPSCQQGAVLITSRSRGAARALVEDHEIVQVSGMNATGAVTLLARKLNQHGNTPGLQELASALERVPLAITQAAAYIRQSRQKISIDDYLRILRNLDASGASLLDDNHSDLRRDADATHSIVLTWQLSFELLETKSKSAADLLTFISLCDRHNIPEFLVGAGARASPSQRQTFEKDIRLLLDFMFVTELGYPGHPVYEMHRLVQLATCKWSNSQGRFGERVDAFVVKLNSVMKRAYHSNSRICESLYPHARSAWQLKSYVSASLEAWVELVGKAADYLAYMGTHRSLRQAIQIGEDGWRVSQERLGEHHRQTLILLGWVAWYYHLLGQYGKAVELEERRWESLKQHLGSENVDNLEALTSMSNLAVFYDLLGKTEKALELEEECCRLTERQLGKDHYSSLVSRSRLAKYYSQLGQKQRAIETERRCWEITKEQYGAEHPETLAVMSSLARYQSQAGQNEKAIKAEEFCWEARKKQLGINDIDTLASMSNLARYYGASGRLTRALRLEERCWEISRKQLGEEHHDTLYSMVNIAKFHVQMGQYGMAVEMAERAFETGMMHLGPEHKDTLWTMEKLAKRYWQGGRIAQAVEMQERYWEAQKTRLGEGNRLTLHAERWLERYKQSLQSEQRGSQGHHRHGKDEHRQAQRRERGEHWKYESPVSAKQQSKPPRLDRLASLYERLRNL